MRGEPTASIQGVDGHQCATNEPIFRAIHGSLDRAQAGPLAEDADLANARIFATNEPKFIRRNYQLSIILQISRRDDRSQSVIDAGSTVTDGRLKEGSPESGIAGLVFSTNGPNSAWVAAGWFARIRRGGFWTIEANFREAAAIGRGAGFWG